MEYDRFVWTSVFMRLSLGVVFIFAAVLKLFFDVAPPIDKIVFFLPKETSVALLGIVEFVVGALLVVGLLTRAAFVVAGLLLVGFILSSAALGIFLSQFMIKDVVLLAVAIHGMMHGAPTFSLEAFIHHV